MNQRPDRLARPRAVLAAMLLLCAAACSGGGESGAPKLTPDAPPTAEPGSDRT